MRLIPATSLLFSLCLLSCSSRRLPAEQMSRIAPEGSHGCPVSFEIQTSSEGTLRPALAVAGDGGAVAKRSVHVEVQSIHGKPVTEALVTLTGPLVPHGATPAQQWQSRTYTKTYRLVKDMDTRGPLQGDLSLQDNMAGVEKATVTQLTYADGTSWRPMDGATCMAMPRNLMEVARR